MRIYIYHTTRPAQSTNQPVRMDIDTSAQSLPAYYLAQREFRDAFLSRFTESYPQSIPMWRFNFPDTAFVRTKATLSSPNDDDGDDDTGGLMPEQILLSETRITTKAIENQLIEPGLPHFVSITPRTMSTTTTNAQHQLCQFACDVYNGLRIATITGHVTGYKPLSEQNRLDLTNDIMAVVLGEKNYNFSTDIDIGAIFVRANNTKDWYYGESYTDSKGDEFPCADCKLLLLSDEEEEQQQQYNKGLFIKYLSARDDTLMRQLRGSKYLCKIKSEAPGPERSPLSLDCVTPKNIRDYPQNEQSQILPYSIVSTGINSRPFLVECGHDVCI